MPASFLWGGGGGGGPPPPRSAARGTLLCLFKRRRGSKGEPSPGVLPFLYASACAPLRWEVFVTLSCDSTPFLWCLPKETVSSRQRKALLKPPHHLGGPTRLSHLGVSPNGTNWCVKLDCGWLVNWSGKVSLTQSAGMLGLRVRGRGGRDRTATVAAPLSAFLWGSTPFLCARAKKWGGTGSRGWRLLPKKTAHTYRVKTRSFPPLPVN